MKFYVMFFIVILFNPLSLNAVELGDKDLTSYLDEPLKIKIPLRFNSDERIGSVSFDILDRYGYVVDTLPID